MIDTNMGFNTHLYNFKNDLVSTINNSGLPVGVVYYVVKDLFIDIQNAYEDILKNERESMLKNIEEVKPEEQPHDDVKKTKTSYKKTEK